MSSREALWSAAAQYAANGVQAALATVSRHRGSLPMAHNAKMLVTREGRKMGTVGGGCVEADVIAEAIAVLDGGNPTLVSHTLNADVAGDLGLSCGGTVELFLEPIVQHESMVRLFQGVAEGIRTRKDLVIATALDWQAGPAKAVFSGDQTVGLDVERFAGHATRQDPLGPATYVDDQAKCFVERVSRVPRILVFGAGHVGVEIARLAARVGFHVVLVDDREDFANASRVPEADEVIVGDFSQVIDGLTFDDQDYVLATTRGHSFDATIVQQTAASNARYVGMLGSRRKRAVIWKALKTAGVPVQALDRVRSPIGIEIGADDPAEIAVSVVAELIRLRRLNQTEEEG